LHNKNNYIVNELLFKLVFKLNNKNNINNLHYKVINMNNKIGIDDSQMMISPDIFPKKRRFNKYFGMFIFTHSLPVLIMK
jgi:hypothetical protein